MTGVPLLFLYVLYAARARVRLSLTKEFFGIVEIHNTGGVFVNIVAQPRLNPMQDQAAGLVVGNSFVHALTLFWLVGVIIFDKNFAYISFGPIYITEAVLVSMILANLRRLTFHDYFLIAVVAFYFVGGLLLKRDPFFAIRDLAWLYYLLFLRFFPRNFPRRYIDITIYACWIRVLLIIGAPLMSASMVPIFAQKYRDGVVVLFLAGYFSLKNPNGQLNLGSAVFLCVLSFLTDYKTLLVSVLVLPFLFRHRQTLSKWHSPMRLSLLASLVLVVIYFGEAKWLLKACVEVLNFGLSAAGIDKTYQTGTAIWRAEIWNRALLKLATWNDVLFGEFPGHNFMNSKFLGIKSFSLSGSEQLGVVRTAHNIIVQIVMKTGLVGLLIYGWYYFRTSKSIHPTLGVIRLLALALAMTADILEVPSRGPLLFCLLIILEIRFINPGHGRQLK